MQSKARAGARWVVILTGIGSLMAAVDARLPERSQQATLRSLDDAELTRLVDEFVAAWERGDVGAVVSMLAHDAVLAMPPEPEWYAGRETVAAFLAAYPLAADASRHRLVPTWANGQPAFGLYSRRADPGAFVRHGIAVLTLRDALIAEFTFFRGANAFVGFDLPECLAP